MLCSKNTFAARKLKAENKQAENNLTSKQHGNTRCFKLLFCRAQQYFSKVAPINLIEFISDLWPRLNE